MNQLNSEITDTVMQTINILEPNQEKKMPNNWERKAISSISFKLATPFSETKINSMSPLFPAYLPKIDLFKNINDENTKNLIEEPKYKSYMEYILF